jgi:hypothetical protein
MRQGVVSEIADVVRKEARQLKDPFTKEVMGRTFLFESQTDGTFTKIDVGGPGIRPAALQLHTLTGLVTYLFRPPGTDKDPASYPLQRDGAENKDVMVRVVNHESVVVESALDAEDGAHRTTFAVAHFAPLIGGNGVPFKFGEYLDLETFNVGLQSLFEDSIDRIRLLRVMGTVKEDVVKTSVDDGVSQTVVASAGTVGVYETEAPNPVRLIPFRTFREVSQPESLFVLRLKKGENGNLPRAALFEADGGAWKLKAIENIATFLRDKLPGVTILA